MKKLFKTLAIMLVIVTVIGVVPVSAKNPNKDDSCWLDVKVFYDAWDKSLGGVTYKAYSNQGYWNFNNRWQSVEDARDNITKAYAALIGHYAYNLGDNCSFIWRYAKYPLKAMAKNESCGKYDFSVGKFEYETLDYIHYRWAKLKKVITKKAKALKVTYTETLKDNKGFKYDNSDWSELFKYTKTDKKLKKHNYKYDHTGEYRGKKWYKTAKNNQAQTDEAFDAMKQAINECKTVEDFYYVLDHIETMIYEYETIMKTCIFPYYYAETEAPSWFDDLGF